MGESYRIKTELGSNKTINVQLDQEFEFLEILSLKIQQADIYTRSCADYGVIVGRVTANNGLGIPNARVAVFVPITNVDESNPLISSIYPYESPSDKNEDGYRYNLLPYEKSYSKHSATGTLPTRADSLTGITAVEIYDTYYRYTAKTNESGDYMIMGVPLGDQAIVMDVDLSDIGEFSLTPQDLIRMGLATEAQVAGSKFRTSTDLNSLPQIVNLVKNVEVSPLWGDASLCQIAINRLDFDLRDDANVDIQPTSVFMGSMFSTADSFRLRANARPRDNMGNLCSLTTSPGQIIAIRQTIQQDEDGNPVLEEYELEQSGNVIDGNGTWLIELPMNLDYLVTNEFGEKTLSNDPSVGVPTKSKYRFKVKWSQPNDLTLQTRRPYYLVPNVKEYGWTTSSSDPTTRGVPTTNNGKQQQSSYYFGLAWSGYTNGFIGQKRIDRLNEVINCEDTFYEFQYNKVYTVSSLIDQFKKGRGNGKFIGIKEIDDQDCEDTVNKFPVNDGFRNFDFLFFLFSIIFTVIQPVALIALTVAHILIFLYNLVIQVICWICGIRIPIIKVYPFRWICKALGISCDKKDYTIRLPMITYPECQACECSQNLKTSRNAGTNSTGNGILSYVSSPDSYYDLLSSVKFAADTENGDDLSVMNSEAIAGMGLEQYVADTSRYKLPLSQELISRVVISTNLPLGERINVFNSRSSYFTGKNKIKLTFAKNDNIGKYHYDNTITVLCQEQFEAGDLLTFVNMSGTTDINYLYSATTADGIITGISGETYNGSGATYVDISYATTQTTNILTPVRYTLPYGSEETNYKFPADLEYYQVVTAITVSDAAKIWNTNTNQSFGNILYANSQTLRYVYISPNIFRSSRWDLETVETISPYEYFSEGENQYVLVLQRGVDPYSPKYVNEYSIGNLFGTNENDPNWTFTATTRINIPIQKINHSSPTIQNYNQEEMYYPSYFFKPGTTTVPTAGQSFTGYNTSNTAYYGLLDSTTSLPPKTSISSGKVITNTTNGFYAGIENSSKYDLAEDVSGLGFMSMNNNIIPRVDNPYFGPFGYSYYTKTFFSTNPNMLINNRINNVLRTDRLPSSDGLDGSSFTNNPSLLQQNNNFGVYLINTDSEDITSDAFSTGAQTVTPDLEGLPNAPTVIESFNCESMVGLDCYTGFGDNFTINQECTTRDAVENGCYMFLRRPLKDLGKDITNFGEWGFRFRFFYGLCRGVLSQSFMNNWINGSLYAFPLQVNTYYDSKNKPEYPRFASDVAYFNIDSNNFYYRSSPWNDTSNKFVGKRTNNIGTVNTLNLLYPTTIINLGMKDYFYSEITFDSSTKGYIIPNIDSTSYGDTSDLINLFVISRITDESFLSQLINLGDNSIDQLFSRPEKRIDGDLAQLMSINSEIGNVNFSPEYYDIKPGAINPTNILGTAKDPIMAVWFSSTTEDLQTKDYLTPGRINFRGSDNIGYYPYPYGIKSQLVPFYQWKLASGSNTIFGNQNNTWATDTQDIIQNNYQGLDRAATNTKYYLNGTSVANNLTARGYIFSVDGDVTNYPTVGGRYTSTPQTSSRFLVGAPFQFYFGVVKGQSALDRFKTKYSLDEN
jgi:hypothetical protein